MTCETIARERLGKHIPAATNTQAIIGYLPLLCNGAVNTIEPMSLEVFSVWFA
jgi:hypothetical protein